MQEPTAGVEAVPIAVAAKLFFPHGGVTVSTLRAAIRKGELHCEMIGRGYFVTREDVESWRKICRQVADARVSRRSTAPYDQSSEQERRSAAKAALNLMLTQRAKTKK